MLTKRIAASGDENGHSFESWACAIQPEIEIFGLQVGFFEDRSFRQACAVRNEDPGYEGGRLKFQIFSHVRGPPSLLSLVRPCTVRTERERFSGDCNQGSQERIESKARTKRGSKIINVRVSLSAAQMNLDKDFSTNGNLIDICFLPVTACVRLPHVKMIPEDMTAM